MSGRVGVPLKIEIRDPLMSPPPRVFIDDDAIRSRVGAHLNTGGDLCYAEAEVEEYDPYNGGGAVLRVLESVRETFDRVLHSSATTELQREFVAYWKAETHLYTDLPEGFSGAARMTRWAAPSGSGLVVSPADRAARWASDKTSRSTPALHAFVLRLDRPMNTTVGGGPGRSLASLKLWTAHFIDGDALERAFAPRYIDGGAVVLVAENGAVAAMFKWPKLAKLAYAKAPPGRRARSVLQGASQMSLERTSAESLALPDLVNARLAAPSPLIGKSVAIVGAGAIGARVAQELSRSGAGQGEYPLLIIDPDIFHAVNFARHVLPISAVLEPKATAVADELTRLHPGLSVEGVKLDVFKILPRLSPFDLIIDATGSNPVGLRLNAASQAAREANDRFPTVLHAAIHGNGLAVQTILVTRTTHACFKCLRPAHGTYKANPLKSGFQTAYISAACGDGAHVDYAASAPAMAAALTVQAALEWARDPLEPGPRVRTRVLDLERTEPAKDKNWAPDPTCPACGGGCP